MDFTKGSSRGKTGLTAAYFSSPGPDKRREFEDRSAALTLANGLTVLIIADGVGGGSLGQRAAELTAETIHSVLNAASGEALKNVPALLEQALVAANGRVFAESQRDLQKRRMGSTAAVAAIYRNRLYVANAGDSRIYHVRGNKVTQVTVDHSWGYEVVKAGRAGPERAFNHPKAEEITRSIGYQAELKVDLGLYQKGGALGGETDEAARQLNDQGLALRPGDFILGCSDGLIKARKEDQRLPYDQRRPYVTDAEIPPQLQNNPPDRAVQSLVDIAIGRDVDDNVTAAVIEVPASAIQNSLRGLRRNPLPAAGVGIVLTLAAVVLVAMQRQQVVVQSTPPPKEIPANQVYVADVQGQVKTKGPKDPKQNSRAVAADGFVDMGQEVFSLADGSAKIFLTQDLVLWLGPNSDVVLDQAAGGKPEVKLLHGQVLLIAATPAVAQVVTERGHQAGLANAAGWLGVRFDGQAFQVDCLNGACYAGPAGRGEALPACQTAQAQADNVRQFALIGFYDLPLYGFAQDVKFRLDNPGGREAELCLAPPVTDTPRPTPTTAPSDTPTRRPAELNPTATETTAPPTVAALPSPTQPPAATATVKAPPTLRPPTLTPAPTVQTFQDKDGDGVPDDADQCPDGPGLASNNGCPEVQVAPTPSGSGGAPPP